MSRLRAVLAIASLGVRRLARDRLGLVFTVALPFTVILLVGLAFGDEDGAVTLAIAFDEDPGERTRRLVEALEAHEALDVVRMDSAAQVRERVQRGHADAGLLIAEPPAMSTLVGAADARGSAAARPVVGAAMARLDNPGAQPPAVTVERVGPDGAGPDGAGPDGAAGAADDAGLAALPRFGYTAPANLVLFTFITSLASAAALIESRVIGVRRRLQAAPLGARHVVAGETLGRFGIALAQALVVVGGAWMLFGVQWGDPAGVAAVVGAFAVVATSAGILLGTFLRTPQQASAVGPMLGIALGMLGGCMWPLEVVGPAMRTAGHATPHAWAVDALVALGGRGAGLGDVLPQVAALGAFAVVLLPLAVWRLSRTG